MPSNDPPRSALGRRRRRAVVALRHRLARLRSAGGDRSSPAARPWRSPSPRRHAGPSPARCRRRAARRRATPTTARRCRPATMRPPAGRASGGSDDTPHRCASLAGLPGRRHAGDSSSSRSSIRRDLHWFGGPAIAWPPVAIYSVTFLMFWPRDRDRRRVDRIAVADRRRARPSEGQPAAVLRWTRRSPPRPCSWASPAACIARRCAVLHSARSPPGRVARASLARRSRSHAGRLFSYAVAGALVASSVAALGTLQAAGPLLRPLWALVHVAAIALGLTLIWTAQVPRWLSRDIGQAAIPGDARVVRVLRRMPASGQAGLAGLCWAGIPCGLLQSALLVAALASGPVAGATVMSTFAVASGFGLWAGPHLWSRMRSASGDQRWTRLAARLSGTLLVASSGFALWHGLGAIVARVRADGAASRWALQARPVRRPATARANGSSTRHDAELDGDQGRELKVRFDTAPSVRRPERSSKMQICRVQPPAGSRAADVDAVAPAPRHAPTTTAPCACSRSRRCCGAWSAWRSACFIAGQLTWPAAELRRALAELRAPATAAHQRGHLRVRRLRAVREQSYYVVQRTCQVRALPADSSPRSRSGAGRR